MRVVQCPACGARGKVDETKVAAPVVNLKCPKCGGAIVFKKDEAQAQTTAPPPQRPASSPSGMPPTGSDGPAARPTPPQPPQRSVAPPAQKPAPPPAAAPPAAPALGFTDPAPTTDPPRAVGVETRAQAVCVSCKKSFPRQEMIHFGQQWVCAECKPNYVRNLRQGTAVPGEMRYGGFWIRAAAKLLDNLIVGLFNNFAISLPFTFLFPQDASNPLAALPVLGVQILLSVLVYFIYSFIFVGKWGATPGKMALKLKIVTAQNTRISYGLAAGRFFAELLSAIILYIGYFMAGFDDEKRALHDRICGTRVVRR